MEKDPWVIDSICENTATKLAVFFCLYLHPTRGLRYTEAVMQNLPTSLVNELENFIRQVVREELEKERDSAYSVINPTSDSISIPTYTTVVESPSSSHDMLQAKDILQRVMRKQHPLTNDNGFLTGKI